MLTIKHLDSYYGKAQVLHDVDIEVKEGQFVALLGPNGAGKTTTMMSISGLVKTSAQTQIEFLGERIERLKPEAIVARGLVHVPQGRGVFPGLTIKENLIMGAYLRNSKKETNSDIERLVELFPKFKERMSQMAGTLSGGEQQMLAIIRGLMAHPKLLMLDEPSMGLAPIIVDQIYETIAQINKSGMTILLVEQNTNMALQVANYAYILSVGGIVNEGESCVLRQDEEMIKSYFKGQH
ncbi:ABC transporter ATP-binding protein [Anaerosporomusa subterranea]|uniref:ABC transporter ATP-binding protein n=1 Tax=Anaerosporomusa subterranea TaxID=1794912 RepID=A0A154BPF3_ANASB|nr:ABC transporter ATP-binding protein [Anaerosporomusa subterranea]KYZ75781.1 ABC transporter ATP-binding protein [Anaerosporomusa subterranea]